MSACSACHALFATVFLFGFVLARADVVWDAIFPYSIVHQTAII